MRRRAGTSVPGGSMGSAWYHSAFPGCLVLVHQTRASCASCPQAGPALGAEMTTVLVKVERDVPCIPGGEMGETVGKYLP